MTTTITWEAKAEELISGPQSCLPICLKEGMEVNLEISPLVAVLLAAAEVAVSVVSAADPLVEEELEGAGNFEGRNGLRPHSYSIGIIIKIAKKGRIMIRPYGCIVSCFSWRLRNDCHPRWALAQFFF